MKKDHIIQGRKKSILFPLLTILIGGFSACETREDFILEHCPPPQVELKYEGDSTYEGKRYLNVVMSAGETVEIDVKVSDIYDDEITRVYFHEDEDYSGDYTGLSKYKNRYYITSFNNSHNEENPNYSCPTLYEKLPGEFLYFTFGEGLDVSISNNKLIIKENTKFPVYELGNWSHDELLFPLKEQSIPLTFENSIGKQTIINIILTINGYQAPDQEIEVKKIDDLDALAYNFTIHATDLNGDSIVMYEYCFDFSESYVGVGELETLCKPKNEGYIGQADNDIYKDKKPVGTDISISYGRLNYSSKLHYKTSLNSINVAFQSKGNHRIAYRCMDETGLWSPFKKYEFTIE